MAFTQKNVNYAADYSRAMADAYPYISYFGEIWGSENANLYKPGMGNTMYIPSLTTSGARAAERDQVTGTFNRNWNNSVQAVSLEMDREWDTLVDPMDMDETDMVATIANVTKAFTEQQKVPEMDAYLASKLYSFVTPDTSTLTTSTIMTKWDNYLEALTNARANRDRLCAYMTPATYRLMKQAASISRYIDVSNSDGNLNRNIFRLDGVLIREVPADLMKSAYDFTEGWAPRSNAVQINMIIVDPDAVAAPVKYEVAMMSEPTAQSKGKYLYYERYYYGAFKLAARGGAIVVSAAA